MGVLYFIWIAAQVVYLVMATSPGVLPFISADGLAPGLVEVQVFLILTLWPLMLSTLGRFVERPKELLLNLAALFLLALPVVFIAMDLSGSEPGWILRSQCFVGVLGTIPILIATIDRRLEDGYVLFLLITTAMVPWILFLQWEYGSLETDALWRVTPFGAALEPSWEVIGVYAGATALFGLIAGFRPSRVVRGT